MKKAFNSVFKNKSGNDKVKDEDSGSTDKEGLRSVSLSIGSLNSIKVSNLPPTPISASKGKSTSSTTLTSNMDKSESSQQRQHAISTTASKRIQRYASQELEHREVSQQQISNGSIKVSSLSTSLDQSLDSRLHSASKEQGLTLFCPSPDQSDDNQPIVTSPSSDGENGSGGSASVSASATTGKSTASIKLEKHLATSTAKSKFVCDGLMAEKAVNKNQESSRMQSNDRSYEERLSSKDVKAKVETNDMKASKVSSYRQDARQIKIGDSIHQQHALTKSSAFKVSSEELSQAKRSFESQKSVRHEEKTSTSSSSSRFFSKSSSTVTASSSSVASSSLTGTETLLNSPGSPIITEPFSPSEMKMSHPVDMDFQLLSLTSGENLSNNGAENLALSNFISRIAAKFRNLVESLKNCSKEKSLETLKSLNYVMEKAASTKINSDTLYIQLSDILRKEGGLDIIIENCGLNDLDPDIKFQSAKLLEQTLSPDNRSYVVDTALTKVVTLACDYSNTNIPDQERVGTGILNQLFKVSEETCKDIIKKGGLKSIVYQCRNTDNETLRHCASALANLSLYGGPENHASMIKEQAPMWLFPLAHHVDDNIAYYACLAIATLVANKEIEAAVLSSGTHELIEPFITDRNPEEFAAHSDFHSRGQSKEWLRRLALVLESDREEARSLAAFHFAMEAWIKKKQGKTSIFREIGVIDRLKRVASSPNATASKYAAQALKFMGEQVPHKLSQQVPLWTVEDVVEWVKQIGFADHAREFIRSRVDGDILLQLSEDMLRYDIKMENGILRRRFLRELGHLKRITDYSSCDTLNLFHLLFSLGQVYPQYTYTMLQAGVESDTVKFLTEEQLSKECRIENSIHRSKIAEALNNLSTVGTENNHDSKKSLDAFISYRRSNGSQLASLLKVHLQLRSFSVFIDIERLEAGKFDSNLLNSIKQAKNFILVLTPNALDRCLGDDECKDWVHKEIQEALASKCNIIPIMDNFQWPDAESLPEDIRGICYFNGVRWIHEYQDACVDKLERFMRGEINSRVDGMINKGLPLHGVPGTPGTPIKVHGYPRAGSIDGLRSPPEVNKSDKS